MQPKYTGCIHDKDLIKRVLILLANNKTTSASNGDGVQMCPCLSLEINRQTLVYLSNMLSQTLHEKKQYDDGLVALSDGHSCGKKKKKN